MVKNFGALLLMLAWTGWGGRLKRRLKRAQVGTQRWLATCQHDAECEFLGQEAA